MFFCSDQGILGFGDSLSYTPPPLAVAMGMHPTDLFIGSLGGTDCSDQVTRYPTYGAPFYRSRRTYNVMALLCGTNDFVHGKSAATAYADLVTTVGLAQATGYTVTVSTIISAERFDTVSGRAWRSDINTLIRSGAATYGYSVWDVATDPDLGCDNCWSNATYFNHSEADVVHLTEAGQAIQAGYLNTALLSIGLQ